MAEKERKLTSQFTVDALRTLISVGSSLDDPVNKEYLSYAEQYPEVAPLLCRMLIDKDEILRRLRNTNVVFKHYKSIHSGTITFVTSKGYMKFWTKWCATYGFAWRIRSNKRLREVKGVINLVIYANPETLSLYPTDGDGALQFRSFSKLRKEPGD